MTNNKLQNRIVKIFLTIFVSIICLSLTAVAPADDKKDRKEELKQKTAESPRSKPSQSPQRTPPPQPRRDPPPQPRRDPPPQPRRDPSPVARPRGVEPSKSVAPSITRSKPVQTEKPTPIPKQPSREYLLDSLNKKLDGNSTNNTTKKPDTPPPTFRRSDPVDTSSKVTTKTAPRQTFPTFDSAPRTTSPTQKSTRPVAKNNIPQPPPFDNARPNSAKPKNKPVTVSEVLRRPKTIFRRPKPNRDDNRPPAPNRVIDPRQQRRNEDIARSIALANQHKSPPKFRHQPSPITINHVRKNFHGYNNYWTRDWYRQHPASWHPISVPDRKWWHRPYWYDTCDWFDTVFLTSFLWSGTSNTYVYYPYYYGNNVVYSGDMVYVNGIPYVNSAEYYRQALELSQTADALVKAETENDPQTIVINQPEQINPQNDDTWLPMGTFAFLTLENENTDGTPDIAQPIIQIATNKLGQIRGNFVDEKNNIIRQMIGAVDPKTQRVALRFVDNDKEVWECGLWNLTQDTLPVLIHYDEKRVEQKTLVRLVNDAETEFDTDEIELAP
ncbi:MAG: hypothetical protein LBL39_08035 [Planctomycetaceae bacterium]|nr:hypothetical protein [Planctomycetaceae bacterium]